MRPFFAIHSFSNRVMCLVVFAAARKKWVRSVKRPLFLPGSHHLRQIYASSPPRKITFPCNHFWGRNVVTAQPVRTQLRPPGCYLSNMRANQKTRRSIAKPLLKELADRHKADRKAQEKNSGAGAKPPVQPDLYQDPGGGYNP